LLLVQHQHAPAAPNGREDGHPLAGILFPAPDLVGVGKIEVKATIGVISTLKLLIQRMWTTMAAELRSGLEVR
jgi:hypothetical protein